MARAAKVLGQAYPTAATDTDIYTVPEATETVVSSIICCNDSAGTPDDLQVAVRPYGEALASKHYIVYDYSVGANDFFSLVAGITLGPGDVITVQAANGSLAISVFGVETTLR